MATMEMPGRALMVSTERYVFAMATMEVPGEPNIDGCHGNHRVWLL